MKTEKKITRGISKEFAESFKCSELYSLYKIHKDELFIGVRNGYLNVYYKCCSIAKVQYKKKEQGLVCWIDRGYLGKDFIGEGERTNLIVVDQIDIISNYEDIKYRIDCWASDEKKAQARLTLNNNWNSDSNWFCIDVEYVKQFESKVEKTEAGFNARFDIIAVSKAKPHSVALIELKYGGGVIGGSSGVVKHVKDYILFRNNNYFEDHLKGEIIDIINSQVALGIDVPFELPSENELLSPEFYFITLNNRVDGKGNTPEQTMAGYLFNSNRWGRDGKSAKENVEDLFGDITRKDNSFFATFLFSEQTLDDLTIDDIIDSKVYKRIIPA